MAKRGRPQTARPLVDLGTPELQTKRLAALGAGHPLRPNWPVPDMSAAESALGVLLWQGLLDSEYVQARKMHDAGVMFAGWWILVYPKTFAHGTLGQFQPGGSGEADIEAAAAKLRTVSKLLESDRAVLDAVINTAIYQRVNLRQLSKLRVGLRRLAEWKKESACEVSDAGASSL